VAKTTIRVARRDDYEGLCAISKELDDFHADALPRFFHRFDGPARSLEWFTEALESPDTLLLVAQHEGVIAGFLSALVRQNPDMPMFVPRRWLQVDNVAVLRAYRGMGIGRALMDEAHAWARAQGLADVELTVWEFNQDAIAFYEALGYTTIVRRLWKGIE
jgi:ribosomal protein S18 acetylase RimI-like enzyme